MFRNHSPEEVSHTNTQEIMDLALFLAGLTEVPLDSGIIVPSENVKRAIFGVDIETADLLLARELGADMVIAHHPGTGPQSVNGYKVMERQFELLLKAGVPIERAQKAVKQGMDARARDKHSRNWDRVAAAARLLKMPMMNIHIPIDILSENAVQEHVDRRLNARSSVKDLIAALKEMPEFVGDAADPVVVMGSRDSYTGKVIIRMAGGISSCPDGIKAYFDVGIGTIVMMHISEGVLKAVKERGFGNIVVGGHMRSDSVGINIFIGELEKRGIEVIPMGGVVAPLHRQ